MALMNCPKCSEQVSEAAAACQNCGTATASAGEAQAAGATQTKSPNTSKKLRLHTLISILNIVIGAAVMAAKMYADGEPGAIPILLVVFGIGWYFITRVRIRTSGAS